MAKNLLDSKYAGKINALCAMVNENREEMKKVSEKKKKLEERIAEQPKN